MSDEILISKVCCNEICLHYCRSSCFKFQNEFKHCPYCGAYLTSEDYAMFLINSKKNIQK